ncbi:hypothetical protein SAMN05216338_1003232 [Bradyrhizobium sp. Rc2d]|nr:hypothetical protein SAMN05216338_1003232 [Bradyrhizobium sp. Rc2d]
MQPSHSRRHDVRRQELCRSRVPAVAERQASHRADDFGFNHPYDHSHQAQRYDHSMRAPANRAAARPTSQASSALTGRSAVWRSEGLEACINFAVYGDRSRARLHSQAHSPERQNRGAACNQSGSPVHCVDNSPGNASRTRSQQVIPSRREQNLNRMDRTSKWGHSFSEYGRLTEPNRTVRISIRLMLVRRAFDKLTNSPFVAHNEGRQTRAIAKT